MTEIFEKGGVMFYQRVIRLFILCVWAAQTGLCFAEADAAAVSEPRIAERPKVRNVTTGERMALVWLGLTPDVNDADIVKLLDSPEKQGTAISLVRYRKITSTTPALLRIVNDDKTSMSVRLDAAEALCDFENLEWLGTIKALVGDPNGYIAKNELLKVDAAGLLARGGDYSHFSAVQEAIRSKKRVVRTHSLKAIERFQNAPGTVKNTVVSLLADSAICDESPVIREQAISAIQRITKKHPEFTATLIGVLEANENSSEERFRNVGKGLLMWYRQKMAAGQEGEPNQAGQQEPE